jgi:hypothetical protein
MNGLATEAEVWDAIMPVLRKWASAGLDELDAWFLLNLFESVERPESRPPLMPSAMRQKLIGKRMVKSRDSLAVVALAFQKDTQTIRRWCRMGIIPKPHAYQTPGGHWRVKLTKELCSLVAKRVAGVARMPKSVLRSRRWKNFKKRMGPVFARKIPLLVHLDAELRDATPQPFHSTRPPKPLDRTLAKLLEVHERGNHAATDFLELRLAARSLSLDGKPVTAAALAQRLGTTRRTLFRRFKNGRVGLAISEADKPLNSGDENPECSTDELDHQYVVNATTSTEIQARPKRAVFGKDLDQPELR